MSYSILVAQPSPGDCAVWRLPDGFPQPLCPMQGWSMLTHYTKVVTFAMAAEVPGPHVPDVVHNALGYFIVSARLRAILQSQQPGAMEFLPIQLKNHKGRLHEDELFVANVLDVVDCSDPARTSGVANPLFPGQLLKIVDLEIDARKVPSELTIFRLAARPRIILVRDDLRDEITQAGVTGVAFITPGAGVRL